MKIRIALTALFCICLLGCTRPEKPNLGLDETVGSMVNFKPGSYWIMQDSASGRVDSFVVYANGVSNTETSDYHYDRRDIGISEYVNPNAEICHFEINQLEGNRVRFYFRILPNNAHSFYDFIKMGQGIYFQPAIMNGVKYETTYTSTTPGSSNATYNLIDTLGATLAPQIGLLRIHADIDTYKHTWLLAKYHVSQ